MRIAGGKTAESIIVSVLFVRQFGAAVVLMFALHPFRLQGRAHFSPFGRTKSYHRLRTAVRNDLLQCVQGFRIRFGLLCAGRKASTERSTVNSLIEIDSEPLRVQTFFPFLTIRFHSISCPCIEQEPKQKYIVATMAHHRK